MDASHYKSGKLYELMYSEIQQPRLKKHVAKLISELAKRG